MTGNPYEPPAPYSSPYASGPSSANPPQQGYPSADPSYPGYQPYSQPSASPYPQGGYDTQPYAPVQVSPYAAYRVGPEHPQGTVILVLGICGFASWGITGLIAWIMGRKALKEIDASGLTYTNRGQIQAGWILGIITTILYGGFTVLYLGFIVVYVIFIVGMLGLGSY